MVYLNSPTLSLYHLIGRIPAVILGLMMVLYAIEPTNGNCIRWVQFPIDPLNNGLLADMVIACA